MDFHSLTSTLNLWQVFTHITNAVKSKPFLTPKVQEFGFGTSRSPNFNNQQISYFNQAPFD